MGWRAFSPPPATAARGALRSRRQRRPRSLPTRRRGVSMMGCGGTCREDFEMGGGSPPPQLTPNVRSGRGAAAAVGGRAGWRPRRFGGHHEPPWRSPRATAAWARRRRHAADGPMPRPCGRRGRPSPPTVAHAPDPPRRTARASCPEPPVDGVPPPPVRRRPTTRSARRRGHSAPRGCTPSRRATGAPAGGEQGAVRVGPVPTSWATRAGPAWGVGGGGRAGLGAPAARLPRASTRPAATKAASTTPFAAELRGCQETAHRRVVG